MARWNRKSYCLPWFTLTLLILFFIVVIYIPSHWVLKRFFTPTGM